MANQSKEVESYLQTLPPGRKEALTTLRDLDS